MLFSIVVPIYKVEKYLKQCVDSILAQSFADFELILVDDGSPDNCPKMCDDYAKQDERVKVVHKQNGGLVSARKAGVEVASGEYIVNVDGDDYIKQGYLEEFAKAIKQYDADVVCVGYFEDCEGQIKENKDLVGLEGFYDREKLEKEIFPILFGNINGKSFPSNICMKALRKTIYKPVQLSVDNSISMGEDYACVKPCIYLANSMYVASECLYAYRVNPKSITKNKKASDIFGVKKRIEVIEKHVDLDKFNFREQVSRLITHSLFNAVTSQFYRNERYGVIKKELKQVLETPLYKQAIANCKTKNRKLKFARFALKHRWFWLIKLYSKIK